MKAHHLAGRSGIRQTIVGALFAASVYPGVAAADETSGSDATYLAQGKEVALKFKAALGSNLMRELSAGGTVPAIGFCNENAADIAMTISEEAGAQVKRVSDRPRNPENMAGDTELAYIEGAKAALARGESPRPALHEIDDRVVGYYPIVTNAMCLQCHGTPGQQVTARTAAALSELYPQDQALGYGDRELRGIFVISMEND